MLLTTSDAMTPLLTVSRGDSSTLIWLVLSRHGLSQAAEFTAVCMEDDKAVMSYGIKNRAVAAGVLVLSAAACGPQDVEQEQAVLRYSTVGTCDLFNGLQWYVEWLETDKVDQLTLEETPFVERIGSAFGYYTPSQNQPGGLVELVISVTHPAYNDAYVTYICKGTGAFGAEPPIALSCEIRGVGDPCELSFQRVGN